MPALFTTTSMRPNSAATRSTPARTLASSATSTATARSACGASSGRRSKTATRAPPLRSRSAIAAPMPDAPPVTMATRPVKSWFMVSPCGSGGDVELALAAESVDLELDDVAGGEIGEAARERDTLGGPGEHEITRLEGEHLAELPDDRVDAEDEVARTRVLSRLAVHEAPQTCVVGVDLVARDEPRARRAEARGALALAPLSAGRRELPVALGEVVDGDVPGDVGPRVGGGVEVARAPSD